MQDMVVGMIMFSSQEAVASEAKRYVSALAVHLAMLFVIGKAQSDQELGVAGCWSASQPVNSVKSTYGAMYMNMLVPVRAFAKALQRDDSTEIKAACTALAELVIDVLTLSEARKSSTEVPVKPENASELGSEAKVNVSASPGEERDREAMVTTPQKTSLDGSMADEGSVPGSMGPPPAQKQKTPPDAFAKLKTQLPATSPASQTGLPLVLDDITASVLRAGCGDTWACRIGGAMGLGVLVKALPSDYLKPWAAQICAALCRVFKMLPEHATAEIAALGKILMRLCLKTLAPDAAAVQRASDGGHVKSEGGAEGGSGGVDAMDVDEPPLATTTPLKLLVRFSSLIPSFSLIQLR